MRVATARVGLIVVSLALPASGRLTATGQRHSLEPMQGASSVQVVLAEVLFKPSAGDTSFVELANVGAGAIDLAEFVLRVDTLELPLPRLDSPIAQGARVLIRFDGRGTIEGNVVHASSNFALRAEGGSVTLLTNDDRLLDRVAWGNAVDAIAPVLGGMPARVERGNS